MHGHHKNDRQYASLAWIIAASELTIPKLKPHGAPTIES